MKQNIQKVFVCLFGFIIIVTTSSMVSTTDSLVKLNPGKLLKKADTTRVQELLTLSSDFLYTDSAKTILYSKQAINLSRKIQYAYGEMRGFIYLGDVYYQSGRYGESYTAFMDAKKIGTAHTDKRALPYFYNDFGLFYNSIQEYDSALTCFHHSLTYLQDTDAVGLCQAYLNIGVTYGGAGDVKKASEYLNKALLLAEEKQLTRNLAFIYMNFGNAYKDSKPPQLQKAADYFKKSLHIANQTNNTYIQSIAYFSLGDICNQQGQFDQAFLYSKQAMAITDKAGYGSLQIYSHIGYSEILAQTHRFEESAAELEHIAKNFSLTLEDRKQYLQTYITLYKAWENYKKAFELADQLKIVNDSITELTNKRNMDILDARFRFQEQETRITDLKKENSWKTRIVNISVLAVLMSCIIIALLIYSRKLKAKVSLQKQQVLKEENARIKTEKALAEEKAVRVKEDLDHKNRELSANIVHSEQMTQLLSEIKDKLGDEKKLQDERYVEGIRKTIKHNIHLQEDWQKFKMHFEEVHPSFFDKLSQLVPQLSKNDLKQCAYIRMNMSNKEVAALLNISPDSVKMSRYRIKKKFNLQPTIDLGEYIASL